MENGITHVCIYTWVFPGANSLDPRFPSHPSPVSLVLQKCQGVDPQEVRLRATVLQTKFENYVHLNSETIQRAKNGQELILLPYGATAFFSKGEKFFSSFAFHCTKHTSVVGGMTVLAFGMGSPIPFLDPFPRPEIIIGRTL